MLVKVGLLGILAYLLFNAFSRTLGAWHNPASTDAISFLAAVREVAQHAALYSPNIEKIYQAKLINSNALAQPQFFLYAPIVPWIFSFLSNIAFQKGAEIISTFQIICLITAIFLVLRTQLNSFGRWAIILTAISLPANWDLALIQWDAPLLLAGVGGWLCLRKGKEWEAGFLFSIILLKPQLIWLLPFFFLRRPKVIGGMALGGAIWSLLCILTEGLATFKDYIQAVFTQNPKVSNTEGIATLFNITLGRQAGIIAAIVMGIVVVIAAIRYSSWLKEHLSEALALGIVASILAAPHLNIYDFVILALPIGILTIKKPAIALLIAIGLSFVQVFENVLFWGPQGLGATPHLESFVVLLIVPLLLWDLPKKFGKNKSVASKDILPDTT